MSRNFPPLGALRAFEAASRHLSFVRAAEELAVTPAAISHQIKQLEHWIGVKLFERGARGVALSGPGQDYSARVRDVFDRLIATTAAVRTARSKRVVLVRAQLSIAMGWLTQRVTQFNQNHSTVEIQLHALPIDKNPSKGAADIAIYQLRADIEGYTQEILLRGHYRLYAAPSLLSRTGVINPEALLRHPLLHTTSVNYQWDMPTVGDWLLAAGVTPPEVLPGMHFNLEHLTTIACMQGAGFALLNEELTRDLEHCGALVSMPGPTIPNPHPYTLMMKKIHKPEVRTVAEWLLKGGRETNQIAAFV
jgi:LysR family transcriptional regulator, glycine cleavage system transcriptional activator